MATNKTIPTSKAVSDFLNTVSDTTKKNDAATLIQILQEISGQEPVLWGSSIIGFGRYHYTYDSGREGDMCTAGFSPRKQNIAIYNTGFVRYPEIMKRLGKYKTGKSCLYIKKLSDVDIDVLTELLQKAYIHMNTKHNS